MGSSDELRPAVRQERAGDQRAIADVHRAAFPGQPVPEFVKVIRESENFVPRYSLVCEHEGAVIAHVQLSYVDDAGRTQRVLCLTPPGVLPEHQRRGSAGRWSGGARTCG